MSSLRCATGHVFAVLLSLFGCEVDRVVPESSNDANALGSGDEDANQTQDAGEAEDAGELTDGAQPAPMDGDIDAQDASEVDAGLGLDAAPSSDANTVDANRDVGDAALPEDGDVGASDSAIPPPHAAARVLYEADFRTGPEGWQAGTVWKHGPVFDDVGWSRNLKAGAAWLTSPLIDLSAAGGAEVAIELNVRYAASWPANQELIYWQQMYAIRTHFYVRMEGGSPDWYLLEGNIQGTDIGTHWSPWVCGHLSSAPRLCEERWIRAAATLPWRPGLRKVQLAFLSGMTSLPAEATDTDGRVFQVPLPDGTFAVRNLRVEVNPKRYTAQGAGFEVSCITGQSPPPARPKASAAVTFGVPAGSTVRRLSVSAMSANYAGGKLWTDGWIIFPDGSRHAIPWADADPGDAARYELVFEPTTTSAVGEFRMEFEADVVEPCRSVVFPWHAELLIN